MGCVGTGGAKGGEGGARRAPEEPDMHSLMFQLKRAHLRALAAARPFSKRVGLTPARYDFLWAICVFRHEPPQHLLWKAFGISRTSASKMVRRLIELGLVQRRRSPSDRRTFLVSLTGDGSRRWRRTFLRLYEKRPFQRRFERAFGDRSWNTFRAVDRLTNTLARVAKHLGDTAWKLYLTRPMRFGPLRLPGNRRTTASPDLPLRRRASGLRRSRHAPEALRRTG
jgi:DNA-binding MarR family transcriptional regulator